MGDCRFFSGYILLTTNKKSPGHMWLVYKSVTIGVLWTCRAIFGLLAAGVSSTLDVSCGTSSTSSM